MFFKKPSYLINHDLMHYLNRYNRISKVSIIYDDLLRFSGSVNVYDKNGKDTLWVRVFYTEFDQQEMVQSKSRGRDRGISY